MKIVSERRNHPELKDGGNENDLLEIERGSNGMHQQIGSEGRRKTRQAVKNPCRCGAHFDSELNYAAGSGRRRGSRRTCERGRADKVRSIGRCRERQLVQKWSPRQMTKEHWHP